MTPISPFFSRLEQLAIVAAGEARVAQVRFGSHTTAVALADGRVGLAMHFAGDPGGQARRALGHALAGLPATDVVGLLGSERPLESSAAVACANALEPGGEGRPGHFLDVLDLRPDDTLGMIGNFIPLLDRIRSRVGALHVFEQIEEEADGILPARLEPELLPRCDVVVISGTTLVNHTLDDLLALCDGAREVVLAGPSTILFPEAYQGTPVTWIAGARVRSPAEVLSRISEDFTFHELRPWLHKVLMQIPSPTRV